MRLTSFDLAFQMKNGSSYQVATTSLNMDQQTFLMELMRMAENQPTA